MTDMPVVIFTYHLSHHQFLCICADFEELCDGVHEALVVEIAHLLDLTVMVPYPGVQLLHEALVGIGLVIVNGPDTHEQRKKRRTGLRQEGNSSKN